MAYAFIYRLNTVFHTSSWHWNVEHWSTFLWRNILSKNQLFYGFFWIDNSLQCWLFDVVMKLITYLVIVCTGWKLCMHMQYELNPKRYINLACRIHHITKIEVEQLQSQWASLNLSHIVDTVCHEMFLWIKMTMQPECDIISC